MSHDDGVRIFNGPLECGFRLLFVLSAVAPKRCDLQRLVSYDYLLIHSGDVDGGPPSLHPSVPYRGGEWLVRRDAIAEGLDLMFARELIKKVLDRSGVSFRADKHTGQFLSLLKTSYAIELRTRAKWIAERFSAFGSKELTKFMADRVGRWGAEFERITALRDLEL